MKAAGPGFGSGRSRRAVLGGTAAGAIGLLGAACGVGAGSQSAKPLTVSKAVNITAWLPPTGSYTEYLTSQVAQFQQ